MYSCRPERLTVLKCLWVVAASAFLLSFQSGSVARAQDESQPIPAEEVAPPARQNPILREFFRERFLGTFRNPDFQYGFSKPSDRFLDDYVDVQIDDFLKNLRNQLDELRSLMTAADEARTGFESSVGDVARQRGRVGLRRAVERLGDRAGDLRGLLALIFVSLDSRSRMEKADALPEERTLDSEFTFMQANLTKATKQIEDYFFAPAATVRVEDLTGENFLINLSWVEQMSRRLEESLRSD